METERLQSGDKTEMKRRRSGYKLEMKWKHISVLSPLRFHFVASSQTFEIRLRGIASGFFEGGTPDEKTEFPARFAAALLNASTKIYHSLAVLRRLKRIQSYTTPMPTVCGASEV